jgi:hypothetical protein
VFIARLDLDEDFVRGLVEQEQAAEQEHQVAPADGLAEHREQIGRQAHHPAEREQEQQARQHREAQPQLAGLVALLGRQAADQDRDEDDVVDAQDDFQGGEHREGDPDVRVEKDVHGVGAEATNATLSGLPVQEKSNFRPRQFAKME